MAALSHARESRCQSTVSGDKWVRRTAYGQMVSKHSWRASSPSVELKSSFLVFQAFHSVRTAPPVAFHPPERDDTRARAPRPRSRYQSAGALPTLATESYLYPYTASVTTLPHVAARGFSHGRAERTEQQLPPKSRHVRSAFTLSTEGCMLTYAELRGYAHQKCADGCRLPPKRSMDACHRLAPRGCFPLVRTCVGKCRISPADFAKDFGNAELGPPAHRKLCCGGKRRQALGAVRTSHQARAGMQQRVRARPLR